MSRKTSGGKILSVGIHMWCSQLIESGATKKNGVAHHSAAAAGRWGAVRTHQLSPNTPSSSCIHTAARYSTVSNHTTTTKSSSFTVAGLLKNYKQLSKFRLSGLVVATAAAGYVAASKESIQWEGLGWTSLGTMLCSSSANALNQLYEVVNDSKMTRTAVRPLPTGRMSRAHAAVFALVTGVTGIYILNEKVNTTTAILGGGNIALYAMVYTPLKQISIINTWIGAVVGAIPPLMGWAGAHGELDSGAFLLAAGLYFWQMPHFMSLAWLCRKDYAAGGYKMLSLVDPTGKRTAACALRNCMYLLPLGALSTWLGITSPYFAYESAFITAGMLLTAANFYAKPSNMNARILFRASLLHLPIFMVAFLLHRIPNTGDDRITLLMEHARLLGIGGQHPYDPLVDDEHQSHTQKRIHNHPSLIMSSSSIVDGDIDTNSSSSSRGRSTTGTSEAAAGKDMIGGYVQPPLPFLPIPYRNINKSTNNNVNE